MGFLESLPPCTLCAPYVLESLEALKHNNLKFLDPFVQCTRWSVNMLNFERAWKSQSSYAPMTFKNPCSGMLRVSVGEKLMCHSSLIIV